MTAKLFMAFWAMSRDCRRVDNVARQRRCQRQVFQLLV